MKFPVLVNVALCGALLMGTAPGVSANVIPVNVKAQAEALVATYSALCVRYMGNVPGLRQQLQTFITVPTPAVLGDNRTGAASSWLVPSRHGRFILTLTQTGDQCWVHTPDASASDVQQVFARWAKAVPSPKRLGLWQEKLGRSEQMGRMNMAVARWASPGNPRVLALSLKTTEALDAPVQAVLSARWLQTGL